MTGVQEFVEKCRTLLDLERQEEIDQSTEAMRGQPIKRLVERGLCIVRLRFQYTYTGLYGRRILVFESESLSRVQTFGPGDIVGVYQQGQSIDEQFILVQGLIFRLTNNTIHITTEDNDDEPFGNTDTTDHNCLFMIVKMANDVTYRRLKHGLDLMIKQRQGIAYHLLDVAFDNNEPIPNDFTPESGPSQWFNEHLDASQREAVSFALVSRDIAIIHGPPGTGKTTTIVEYILQEALKRDAKVLCCAPSNIAVDNLVERLGRKKQLKLIRLGHPARLLESIQKFSLESIVMESHQDVKNALRDDLDECFIKLRKPTTEKSERESLKKEIRHLRKDIRNYEEKASREAMQSAHVILCTLTSATDDSPLRLLPPNHFDLVVIDECSQAMEVACWLALLRAPKCVLAGDHLQLPPTILNEKAAKDGLAITLMQRWIEQYGDRITRMLTVQYRMNEAIMNWSSKEFYKGQLIADDSVKRHLLKDLSNVEKNSDDDELEDENLSQCPLYLIDTTGYDMPETSDDDENSRGNEGETALVSIHVNELVQRYGVSIDQIGVITPYNMQVQMLRQKLLPIYPTLEIKSVDGFQGREKEVIIISMVRSNLHGEVGFLSDSRRINVAITRARRHLCIICNVQTVTHDPFIKRLIDYMLENGQMRSAFEMIDEQTFFNSAQSASVTRPKKSAAPNKQKKTKKSNREANTHRSEATETLQIVLTNVLEQRIKKFLDDNTQSELQFEDDLSSYGRLYVHQLAEQHNLEHVSEGVGADRHITIRKKCPTEDQINKKFGSFSILDEPVKEKIQIKNPAVQPKKGAVPIAASGLTVPEAVATAAPLTIAKTTSIENIESQQEVQTSSIELANNKCRFCLKAIPTQNFQLHEIYCQRVNPLPSVCNEINQAAETSSKLNVAIERPKTVKKKENKIEKANADASFDELLEAARQQDNICNAQRCKVKITILGQTCSYCNRRYCLEHSMPEVHGCGDRARREIRQTHLASSHTASASVPERKRPYLERKLQEKITSKENQRKKK